MANFIIACEFSPFLIHMSTHGVVQRVFERRLNGQILMSSDHPALQVSASPTAGTPCRVRRPGGYEGVALTPDSPTIRAFLAKLFFVTNFDQADSQIKRFLQFSVLRMDLPRRSLRPRLVVGTATIDDFNSIDATRRSICYRNIFEGDPGFASAQGVRPRTSNLIFCYQCSITALAALSRAMPAGHYTDVARW